MKIIKEFSLSISSGQKIFSIGERSSGRALEARTKNLITLNIIIIKIIQSTSILQYYELWYNPLSIPIKGKFYVLLFTRNHITSSKKIIDLLFSNSVINYL